MKKRIFLFLLLLAMAAIAYFWLMRKKNGEEEQTLLTARAQVGYIGKSITATGTIQPLDSVTVGAQVSGVVSSVNVDFNSVVKKGQLLATIDPSIINAQLEQSRAGLANVQSNLEYQQNNFERQQKLFDLGAISKADYQLARNQYNSAKAAVANASAQLRLVERNLYYTNIYSPIDGVVLSRNVSAGQTIASSFNAPTLFVIARDLTRMQVRAYVDEADIGGVMTGQHVTFTVDAYPEDLFEGKVQQILLRPTVSANVVTYTTLVNVENASLKLKPGMTASINVYLEEDSNVLLIPYKALNFRPDSALMKKYVVVPAERRSPDSTKKKREPGSQRRDSAAGGWQDIRRGAVWVRSGDTLREKKVLTGISDGTSILVIRGLVQGEEVVTGKNANSKNSTAGSSGNAQRSPFMPQQQRRPTGGQAR